MAKGREKKVIKQTGEEQQRELGEGRRFESTLTPQTAGYGEFAKTGGISPSTIGEIRRRTAGGISSLYGDLQNRLAQNRMIQGGYNPGYGAQLRGLGRDLSQTQAGALRDTDIGIQDLIRRGRMEGLGGLGDVARQRLASIQGTAGNLGSLYGIQSNLAQRPGIFDNIMKYMQTSANMAGAMGG